MDNGEQKPQSIPTSRKGQMLIRIVFVDTLLVLGDLLFLFLLSVATNFSVYQTINSRSLSILLFAESGVVFIIAGGLALSYSVSWARTREYIYRTKENVNVQRFREGEKKATPYLLMGALLFAESFFVAALDF